MAEYTDGIERINIELSLRNKLKLCDELEAFFSKGSLPLGRHDDANEIPSAELLEDRVGQALALIASIKAEWQGWLDDVDELFLQLQDHSLRASWKTQLRGELKNIFAGGAFAPTCYPLLRRRRHGTLLNRNPRRFSLSTAPSKTSSTSWAAS